MKKKSKYRLTRKRKKYKENLIYQSFLKDWKDDIHSNVDLLISVLKEEDYVKLRSQGLWKIYLNARVRAGRYFRRFGKRFAVIPESVEFAKRIGISEERTPVALKYIQEFEEMDKYTPGKPESLSD